MPSPNLAPPLSPAHQISHSSRPSTQAIDFRALKFVTRWQTQLATSEWYTAHRHFTCCSCVTCGRSVESNVSFLMICFKEIRIHSAHCMDDTVCVKLPKAHLVTSNKLQSCTSLTRPAMANTLPCCLAMALQTTPWGAVITLAVPCNCASKA